MALLIHDPGNDPEVTEEMDTTEFSRAVTVRTTPSLGYASQDLLQALTQIDNRLKGIEQGMRMNVAQKCNMRIVNQNRRLQLPDQLRALQKTNPGYGRDKALPLTNVLDAAGRHAFNAQFPLNGVASATGSTPPPIRSKG